MEWRLIFSLLFCLEYLTCILIKFSCDGYCCNKCFYVHCFNNFLIIVRHMEFVLFHLHQKFFDLQVVLNTPIYMKHLTCFSSRKCYFDVLTLGLWVSFSKNTPLSLHFVTDWSSPGNFLIICFYSFSLLFFSPHLLCVVSSCLSADKIFK